jgi:hypothetical protein
MRVKTNIRATPVNIPPFEALADFVRRRKAERPDPWR